MIAARLAALRAEVEEDLAAAGRPPGSVRILGVTKTQTFETIRAAIAAGLDAIGENYLQEARTKFADLPPVEKHFIGHLQTNKAKAVVELFDVVQSIDRLEAGLAVAKAARSLGKPMRVLLQLNISPTERFGMRADEAAGVAERLRSEGLDVDGVMAIGPLGADRAEIRAGFDAAARIFDRIGGTMLSIGMSADRREAIAAGSTMIRIGTALFGARA